MVTSASLVAQLVAGKATRDALFLSHFDLKLLPAAMIGGAVLSALSVIVMSRALSKLGPARVVPIAFGTSALLFVCELWLSLESEHAAAIAVYAHTSIFSTAIGSAFWSLVNERFDPHEAKRLVGRIASGGTVGGVVGGLLIWQASSRLSVPKMLAILATMSIIGLWGSFKSAPQRRRRANRPRTPAPLVSGGGTRILGDTPYLRDLALLVGVGAIVQALLDWLLSQQATSFGFQGQRLLGFFALFNMAVGVLSFAAQTGLTRVILEKRGLGGTIKLQPMSVAVAAIVALVTPLGPLFYSVVVLRVIEGVTRSSLYRSAYELFYTPLPNAKKRATKTIIDVGVDRVGTALGSGVLFAIAHLAGEQLQVKLVLFGVLAMAGVSWVISGRLQDGYVSALASSLKSGAVALDDDDAEDLTTKKTLAETTALLDRDKLLARIEQFQRQKEGRFEGGKTRGNTLNPASERASASQLTALATTGDLGALVDSTDPLIARCAALRSNEPAAIKRALVAPVATSLTPFIVPLLANDTVVRDAVRALRKIAPKVTGLLVDHLLDVEIDPRVRRRIPRVLKVCRTQRAVNGLLLGLRDPVFEVRVQVAIALAQLLEDQSTTSAGVTIAPDSVFDIVIHELTAGRASWTALGAGDVSGANKSRGAEEDAAGAPSRESHDPAADAPVRSEGSGDALRRGLAHVFALLGLVLEREPLNIAYRALRAEDAALRGTAFEYLEVVLPPRVRDLLVPLLGDVKPPAKPDTHNRERATELAAELLRSQAGTLRPSRQS